MHSFFYSDKGNFYRIDEEIAAGGYGAVYKVTSRTDGHRYALKVENRDPNRDHFKLIMEERVSDLLPSCSSMINE